MVKCKFAYTDEMLNKVANNSTKISDMILEICCGLMLVGAVLLLLLDRTALGITALIVLIVLVLTVIINNLTARRINLQLLGREVEITFNKENIVITTTFHEKEVSKTQINYSVIKAVKEVEGLLYLKIDKGSAVVIPTKSFENIEDYNLANELINKNYIVK